MMIWTSLGVLLSVLNLGLLALLVYVWMTNYRQYQTALTLGFLCFGSALILENIAVLYMWYMMEMIYVTAEPTLQVFLLATVLQFVALVSISWVTVR
jgi:hypothetical protein